MYVFDDPCFVENNDLKHIPAHYTSILCNK